ncbi:MAG: hypothetical protein ABL901_15980 [Hyphomicrobiaceae bacterium]|nr:hypothetical protein [Hyphomicrobiaceae bacterium]
MQQFGRLVAALFCFCALAGLSHAQSNSTPDAMPHSPYPKGSIEDKVFRGGVTLGVVEAMHGDCALPLGDDAWDQLYYTMKGRTKSDPRLKAILEAGEKAGDAYVSALVRSKGHDYVCKRLALQLYSPDGEAYPGLLKPMGPLPKF